MLSAVLDLRYVFASYELCDFREVALPLWLAHPNPACQPVPCRLLHPLPPHSFCTNHLDLPPSPTSRLCPCCFLHQELHFWPGQPYPASVARHSFYFTSSVAILRSVCPPFQNGSSTWLRLPRPATLVFESHCPPGLEPACLIVQIRRVMVAGKAPHQAAETPWLSSHCPGQGG